MSSDSYPRAGGCQCGSVRYEIRSPPIKVYVCHCSECRKQSASAFGISVMASSAAFSLTRGTPKRWSRPTDSGGTLDCYFCPDCGSRVFSTNLESFPGAVFATLGCIDNPAGIEPILEMFVKRRLTWVAPLPLPQLQDMPH